MPHTVGKFLTKATTLLYPSLQLTVYTKSYGLPKLQESQFWDSQLGSFGTKCYLGVGPMARHEKYYKGEGDGFPRVWVVVSLVSPCLPMVRSCTKNVPIMH
jgi:hypothetical protein